MSSCKKKLINAKLYVALLEDYTIEEKKKEILECLDAGANVNEHFINDCNNTPLHIAVKNEEPEIVHFLLQRGANANNINDLNEIALDVANDLKTESGHAIVKLLTNEVKIKAVSVDNTVKSDCSAQNYLQYEYHKRIGTSGIEGQLYETKLLSLILIRALVNERIDQFYLGTSLNEIDALDDICIRYQAENERYIIFLQAKHRKDVKKGRITYQELWRGSGDFSLPKYFRSYLKIREKFAKINDDVIYEGKYEDVKCIFIIYTPGTHDLQESNIKQTTLSPIVNDLIWSGKCCEKFQYEYTDKDVNLLKQTILLQDMKNLGTFLFELKDKYNNMMSNDYIRKFHVVLAQKVFNIGAKSTGFRWGTFRNDFFSSNDELLMTLKETIFYNAVSKTNVSKTILKKLIQNVTQNLTVKNLSKLLQDVTICLDLKKNVLLILDNRFKYLNSNLSSLKVSPTLFSNALEIATKEKLHLLHFKLPITFGNIDIVVRDDARITYLANQIKNIISKTEGKIINITKSSIGKDKLIEPGVVQKGGLGSAIGNLLILDQNTKMVKFNMDYKTLGQKSRKLLKQIESIPALETYRLQIDINDFPKLTFDEEYNERITKNFFDNLWFFTSQAKEDETEKYSNGVLYEYHNTIRIKNKKKVSSVRCDAIYFKIHDAIQKWWLKDGKSHYLTNKSQYYNKLLNDFEGTSILSILNYTCTAMMDKYKIEFNENSIDSLELNGELIIIETEVTILTGIKLMQYFRNKIKEIGSCTFLDLDYVLTLSEADCDSVMDEIKNTKLETLIIIFENKTEIIDVKKNIVYRFISESTTEKLIIVTNANMGIYLKENVMKRQVESYMDYRNNLIDLTPDSQCVVLENYLTFQGVKVKWNKILNEESKRVIKANILYKIMNNEKIEISKILTNSKYEEMKHYYITRSLRCPATTISANEVDLTSHASLVLSPYSLDKCGEIIVIKTLEDLSDVVVLLAAPGMGKSTFLTHLSLATKEVSPGLWIERIDLIDYEFFFNHLRENKMQINIIKAIEFICKIVLSKRVKPRYNIEASINELKIDIELQDGKIKLKKFEDDNIISLLTLELFIDCYNKRNTILLFDGFDEICPRNKVELTSFLKCLIFLPAKVSNETSCMKQKMWITSRSYNNIRRTLEAEFGTSYILEQFTAIEQEIFMENYMKANLNLRELSNQQYGNIDGLFEYVKLFANRTITNRKTFKMTDLILRGVYFGAVKYFQSEIKHTPLSDDKKVFVSKWNLLNLHHATISDAFPIRDKKLNDILYNNREMQNVIQTPLHMYVAIEFLKSIVKDETIQNNEIMEKWNLDVNTMVFYEKFFNEKFVTILFKEKDAADLNNSRVHAIYEKERKELIDNHKKIAFYSLFKDDYGEILSKEVVDKIENMIHKMESGEEGTGIVDYIINGVPKFIHLCFAEYLAVECISDLIKTTQHKEQIKLWKFILHQLLFKGIRGVLSVLDLKLCNDCDLRNAILNLHVDVKEFIFNELLEQTLDPSDEYALTVLDDVVVNSLRYIAKILLTVVTDIVNCHNYDKFNKFLQKSTYFCYASVDLGFTELMEIIFDCTRKSAVLHNMISFEDKANNTEIINSLKIMLNPDKPNDNLEEEAAQLAYIY